MKIASRLKNSRVTAIRKAHMDKALRALITGVNGFVGSHLSNYLTGMGWHVYGYDMRAQGDSDDFYQGELTDIAALKHALIETQPDYIFHLAGMIKSSEPTMLYDANLLGTISLLDTVMEQGKHPTVLVASSSAVYGSGHSGRPISEKFKPRPITHYAVSKLAQEIASLRCFDAFDLPVMVVRMFNLLGPGQSPNLACSAFARQIALGELRKEKEIITGDLSARRDFVDVRDAVRALALVAEKGKAGQVYNVCSGRAVLMQKCLGEMLSMSPCQFKVRIDAGKVQKNDVPIQIGDARKLNRISGWHPQIKLKQSLFDLLSYWRLKVKSEME